MFLELFHSVEKLLKIFFGLFLLMGFNCLKATEPLQGNSLLFITKFLKISGTHLIDLERCNAELTFESLIDFEPGILGLGIQCFNHWVVVPYLGDLIKVHGKLVFPPNLQRS